MDAVNKFAFHHLFYEVSKPDSEHYADAVYGSIVAIAFLGSVAVFACFSGAALLSKRREYLFLAGILSSAVSTLLLLQFGSLFFGRSAFMYNLEVISAALQTLTSPS